MSDNTILELQNVSLTFGGLKAVSDVNFKMKNNEILSLIGPNGAGKTSTFNLITGVYTATSGDILYKGKNLKNINHIRLLIWVLQEHFKISGFLNS